MLGPSLLSWEGEHFIRVREAPPRLIVVREGGALRLSCSVLASPAPRVTWSRAEAREVREPGHWGAEDSLAETVAVLSVLCVDRSHSGVFRCRGESGERMVEEVTRVVITSGPGECGEEEGEPPVITNWFKTLMVPIGEPAALDCKIKVHIKRVQFEFIYFQCSIKISAQKSDIEWRRGGGRELFTSARDRHGVYNGSLVIPRVEWGHMGQYICTANNGFGAESVATFLYPLKLNVFKGI